MPPEHLQAEAEEEGRRRDGQQRWDWVWVWEREASAGRPTGQQKERRVFVSLDPADDDQVYYSNSESAPAINIFFNLSIYNMIFFH